MFKEKRSFFGIYTGIDCQFLKSCQIIGKMVSFSLNSEILTRLHSFCNTLNNNPFVEIIFGEYSISIPTEVAASLSSYFYNTLISDITITRIDLNNYVKTHFRKESNKRTILNLINDNTFEVTNLSDEDILDFFEFGCSIGCSLFLEPLFDKYAQQNTNNIEHETIENILSIITYKSILHNYSEHNKRFKDIKYDKEIEIVSSKLFDLFGKKEFEKWCLDPHNYESLERIISNDNVCVNSEDSLLKFIVSLSQRNDIFLPLLHYVFFEYCSIECISDFICFIKNRIQTESSKEQESLLFIECLSRRCLKLSNGTRLESLKRHHEKMNKITEIIFDESNPKKGILNHEYLKQNIKLEASSINSPNASNRQLTDLFVNMGHYTFYTKDEKDSSITATIKDNKSFIINKYMIRGNWNDSGNQLKSWKVKGQLSPTKEWIELDSHTNAISLIRHLRVLCWEQDRTV